MRSQVNLEGVIEVDDEVLGTLVRHCPALQHVNIARCIKVTDAGLSSAATQLPRLSLLDCSDIGKLSDALLEALAASCGALTDFRARKCPRLTDQGMALLASRGPRLRSLAITSNDLIGPMFANALAQGCKDCLEDLDVGFCRYLDLYPCCPCAFLAREPCVTGALLSDRCAGS